MSDYAFDCPACEQEMLVTDQDSGRDITCPHCGAGMTLPNWNEAEPEPEVEYRELTADDLAPLAGTYDDVAAAAGEWGAQPAYMFGLMGALLHSRIRPFAHAIPNVQRQQQAGLSGLLTRKSKVNKKLNEQCTEHLQRLDNLLGLVDGHMSDVLYGDDVSAAVGLCDAIGAELDAMWDFYLRINAHALGEDSLTVELHGIVISWVPWVLQNLLALGDDLLARSARPQRPENPLTWQLTLVPPNIHTFFALKAQLT